MQYHYVVFYDSEKKGWNFCYDPDAYFPDGNVWSDELADETGAGWMVPFDDPLDQTLSNILYSLVDIIPIPKEHEHATS